MKKIALTALMLTSTTALATSTRVSSFQGNVGLTDDTHYLGYASKTDDVGNNGWFNYDGANLGGAATWDGQGVSFSQGEDRVNFGWQNADGDSGYRVNAGIASTEAIALGGAYGMSSGDRDMDFGAAVDMNGDAMAFGGHFRSRELTKTDVTFYGGSVSKNDAGINIGGDYAMGKVWGSDASNAALTYGPGLTVGLPDGGDMALGVSLAKTNLAGEVSIKDWLGIRGSVAAQLDLVDPTGELDVASSMSTGFGASVDTDTVDIDLMVSPDAILGGPHFLTGVGMGPAMSFSARFDI